MHKILLNNLKGIFYRNQELSRHNSAFFDLKIDWILSLLLLLLLLVLLFIIIIIIIVIIIVAVITWITKS